MTFTDLLYLILILVIAMDFGLFFRGTRQTLLQWKPGPRAGLDPRADLVLSEGVVGPGQGAVTSCSCP